MKLFLTILAAGLLVAGAPLRAESLGDLIANHGGDWIIGSWADKATNGAGLKLTYEWRLDRHAIAVKVETSEMKAEGMIARNPTNGDIGYISVDNRGGGALGKFSRDEGKVVLKIAYTGGDGEAGRLGIVHEKTDQDTLTLTVRRLSEGGELGEVRDTFVLARQKS